MPALRLHRAPFKMAKTFENGSNAGSASISAPRNRPPQLASRLLPHTRGTALAVCSPPLTFGDRPGAALHRRVIPVFSHSMKTAVAQQVPQQWTQILGWLAADEEVQVTQDDRVVARILPAPPAPAPATPATPDFLARACAIWGTAPAGEPLSALVDESRGAGVL
jgi:antitoxin (DNA-binding transcriptional repressor) of toxin-antitoxin stability system